MRVDVNIWPLLSGEIGAMTPTRIPAAAGTLEVMDAKENKRQKLTS